MYGHYAIMDVYEPCLSSVEVGNERLQHVGEKCSNLGSHISTTRRGTSANSTNLSFGRRPEPKSVEFADVLLLYYRDVGDFRFETSETSDAVFRSPPQERPSPPPRPVLGRAELERTNGKVRFT